MTKSGTWANAKGKNGSPDILYTEIPDGIAEHKSRCKGRLYTCLCTVVITVILVLAFAGGFLAGSHFRHDWTVSDLMNIARNKTVESVSSLHNHNHDKRDVHPKVPSTHGKTLRNEAKHQELLAEGAALKKPSTGSKEKLADTTPFTFEDIYDPLLRPKSFSGNWAENDMIVYQEDDGNVYSYDVSTELRQLLLPNTTLEQVGTNRYYVAPGLQYFLLAYNIESLWRYSYNAQYKIYNVSSGQLTDFPNDQQLSSERIQFAGWSKTKGLSLSFVFKNNLYYQASITATPVQVTFSGDALYIYNGVPDWLYEEDVLGSRLAHFFSPDDGHIAYVQFNDTGVPLQSWPHYGSQENIYSIPRAIPYPKAGNTTADALGALTKVKIFVVSTADVNNIISLEPPASLANSDFYYSRITWVDSARLYVVWSNRANNDTLSYIYDVTTGIGNQNYREFATGGWIDLPYTAPWFIDDGTRYVTILPKEEAVGVTWPHVALVTIPTGGGLGVATYLTSGAQRVTSVVGVEGTVVYYISTNGDPTERHLFGVDINTPLTPVCFTCNNGPLCRYVSASFSGSGRYYILSCLGPDVPSYTLNSTDGTTTLVLEDNTDARARLAAKQLPTRQYFSIPLDNGNHNGLVQVSFPYNYTEGEKYRLLVSVYAGPNSQSVTKRYNMGGSTSNWLAYLSSSYNVVVAVVDGRGTAGQSIEYSYLMYKRIGEVEIEDQLAGVDYLKSQPYIDPSQKAAIYGWSYGGFSASHSLANSSVEQFQCALSVAPVTTFRFYDSAYTERYQGFDLPSENQHGYDKTDVVRLAPFFKNKTFFLAHGTADDNVHFMNSANLIKALADQQVQFWEMTFVDENHSIGSPNQNRHLLQGMTDFLVQDCWV